MNGKWRNLYWPSRMYFYNITSLIGKLNIIYYISNIETRNTYFPLFHNTSVFSVAIAYLICTLVLQHFFHVLFSSNDEHIIGVQYWNLWCQKKWLLSYKSSKIPLRQPTRGIHCLVKRMCFSNFLYLHYLP